MATEAESIQAVHERLDDHARRLDGHDRHIADLSVVVFGNLTMQVPGLARRADQTERRIDGIEDYLREQKLLFRVGVGLLTALTAGGGIALWPSILATLAKIVGG